MFGRFLELSLETPDIAVSASFYQRLGFQALVTGDTYGYRYGVYSDGRMHLGLHESAPVRSALCFVLPDLAGQLRKLRATGMEPGVARLDSEQFNELLLEDPEGNAVRLIEARTYSPDRSPHESQLGHFTHWSLPVRDPVAAARWWEQAGFVALPEIDAPYAHQPLTSDHLDLAFHSPQLLAAPCLVFTSPDMPERLAALRASGVQVSGDRPRSLDPARSALLQAPEGTLLLLLQSED
jgi:hypothetical protein